MRKYKVKTQFIFEGEFEVLAENQEEANRMVEEDCGLVLGGDIHTTLNDEDVNWNFNTHPNKKIKAIKAVKPVGDTK
jgi:hypothetical protein